MYICNMLFVYRDDGDGDEANQLLTESFADYETGGYSPKYLSNNQLEPGTFVTSEEDDEQRLRYTRLQVLGLGARVEVRKTPDLQT
jgi:hypothetical protein